MPANDDGKKVSSLVWLFLFIAILCDLLKIFCFFLNALPGVGTALDAAASFVISVVEITVVFGGLWFVGIYKPGTRAYIQNFLLTIGVSAIDLVPILDDIPFTSPIVFFMIVRAYVERSKLGSLVGAAALGAATGGVGLAAAEGAEIKAAASTAQKMQAANQARARTPGNTSPKQDANDNKEAPGEYNEAA